MRSKTYEIIAVIFMCFLSMVIYQPVVLGHHGILDGGGPPDGPPPDPPCNSGCCGCCSDCCGGGGGGGGGGNGPAVAGDPVFMRNGEFARYETDLSIPGRSLSVDIRRTYMSRREYSSRFGYGWDINYNIKIRRLSDPNDQLNKIVLLDGKCSRYEYTKDDIDPNNYVRSTKLGSYFTYDDSNDVFTLIYKSGVEYHFDIDDKLSSIEDEYGNSITFTYDTNGLLPLYGPSDFFLDPNFGGPATGRGLIAMSHKLLTITDDLGREISFSYDSDGLLDTITDFTGRTWDYYYDPNTNDLLGVTGPNTDDYPNGLTISYSYDTSHNLEYAYDANNQQILKNYYDSEDKAWKQDIGDGSFEFAYDDVNSTTTITNPEGFVAKTVYNEVGKATSYTIYTANANDDPNSFTTTYAHNSSQQKIRVIYPAGNCTDYTYDSLGDVNGIYNKTGPAEPNDANDPNVIATIYTYDTTFVHKIKTIRDPEGNITTYDYNDLTGNLEKITYPTITTPDGNESPVLSIKYNTYGQETEVNAPDGTITRYEYYADSNDTNNFGRLWKVIADYNTVDGLNITSEYAYNAWGDVIEVNDPNGDVAMSLYNELNQLVKATTPSPFGYVTRFSYDKNGNKERLESETSDANQVITYSYSVLGNMETMTYPLSNVTTYGYNKNRDPNLITDAENNNTTYEYNERGLLWKITDANDNLTEYGYDDNGNLTDINDANNNVTSYQYDGFDRLIKITYPDDSNEVFGYDKNSNVTSKKNRKGEIIYYEYDAMNQMVVKNRPADPNIVYRYDIAGRVYDVNDGRAVSEGGGITSYSYDRIGRISDVNDTESGIVSYEYDARGLRTKLTYPDDSYITYEYDTLGRLAKIKDNNSPTPNVLAQYSYDELSRRSLLTLGNDANAVYEYDLGNRLLILTNNIDDTSSIVFDYNDHDNVGNRLRMKVDDANAHVYTYDEIYQLILVDYNDGNSTSYTYDSLGNRIDVDDGTSTVYTTDANGLNQYASVGGASYSYDKNGNLTDDGTYEYYFDCENRLTDVNQNDSPVASYSYDYIGRRISKTVYGSPDVTTKYCYDGDQVIAEYDGSDTLLRKFVYGPGIDEPILMIDVADNNALYYYHFDGLGSVIALSDTNGDIMERYSYDVFGEPNTTSSIGNPYMFTGRRYDSESGNYYYRARYYHPEIGKFLQPDPIGYWDSMNLYQYCINNPINWIDPFGLDRRAMQSEHYFFNWLGRLFMRDLPRSYAETIKSVAIKSSKCIVCTVECATVKLIVGEGTKRVVKKIIKKAAKKLGKAFVKNAIPVVNIVTTIDTGRVIAKCLINCAKKEN